MVEVYFVCPECGEEETMVVPREEVYDYQPTCPECGEDMEIETAYLEDGSLFL